MSDSQVIIFMLTSLTFFCITSLIFISIEVRAIRRMLEKREQEEFDEHLT